MKIVFQHTPKCAGSSIHSLLVNAYQDKKFHAERFNALDKYGLDSLIQHDIFSGHFDAWRVGLIPGPKFVFTFLREPEARIVSLYNFWRSHTWEMIEAQNLHGPRIAKSCSFEDFLSIEDRGIPANIDNVYVRQALGRSQSLEIDHLLSDDPKWAVESALSYYRSLNFIGAMETIDSDTQELCALLKIPFASVPFENKGEGDEGENGRESVAPLVITDKAQHLLALRSKLDQRVYRHLMNEKGNRNV